MKVIDEKGKILGKINVIDFITIVLIVSIVPMFYLGSELAAFKRPAKNKAVRIKVQIKFPRVIPEVASVISEGDNDEKKGARGISFLKRIIVNKNSEMVALGKNDQVVIVPDPTAREIIATFDLICVEENGQLDYKGHIVKIGNGISFSTDLYSIAGIVVGIKK